MSQIKSLCRAFKESASASSGRVARSLSARRILKDQRVGASHMVGVIGVMKWGARSSPEARQVSVQLMVEASVAKCSGATSVLENY